MELKYEYDEQAARTLCEHAPLEAIRLIHELHDNDDTFSLTNLAEALPLGCDAQLISDLLTWETLKPLHHHPCDVVREGALLGSNRLTYSRQCSRQVRQIMVKEINSRLQQETNPILREMLSHLPETIHRSQQIQAKHPQAPQTPARECSDAMSIYAPQRRLKRREWQRQSLSGRPDLLPWDLGLDWSADDDELAENLTAMQFMRLDTRYTISPTRAEAFALMKLLEAQVEGFQVIPHQLTPAPWEAVVYTTEYGGHIGHDKIRMTPAEQPSKKLCSRFLPCDPLPGHISAQLDDHQRSLITTWGERELVWGDWMLHGTLMSVDWRSNVDCVHVIWDEPRRIRQGELGSTPSLRKLLGPLFAIDFVTSQGRRYALDFNVCPGATGANHLAVPGQSALGAISEWQGWKELKAGL